MKEKQLYLLLVLMMGMPLWAHNQDAADYTIKGQVVDSLSNETVPYATLSITLANAPQKAIKLLACDDDGKFTATLEQPGKYVMSMQSLGKVPAVKSFTLSENKKNLDLGKLYMNDDSQQLNEVTVVAQKPLVKVEIDKITYSLEDDPEAQTNNTLDMLRKVPMVTVDGEDKIQLKGSTNYKIYMNGKPSNLLSGENTSDALKGMPASSIKNIEVITDPGAKYDAEGIGGIINIITTKNALQGYTGTVRANASTLGRMGGGGYLSAKIGSLGLTANYNYNHNNSPWNDSYSTRKNMIPGRESIMNQDGRSKNKGSFQFGYLEASYEIDTLNLISVGANLFRGNMTSLSEYSVEMLNQDPGKAYCYDRHSSSKGTFGSTDLNVDYQHSTSKKDELLTLSYRFSNSPNDNEGRSGLFNMYNFPDSLLYPQWNINDASTTEHTAQVDYTTPFCKNQTIEVGGKYIFRQSDSETLRQIYDPAYSVWRDSSEADNGFKHTQHIYSGYLGYALKFSKFGLKAGVRAEGTNLSVKYAKAPEQNFNTNYFDVVPNATFSYQLSMSQQLRLGYNMRIQRPGIWYLNPYVNTTDPENISYGNPNLDSEKSNNVNFNYSMFSQKFNLNASANYTFVNNAIERYTFVNGDGVAESTYGNIGKRQQVGMFVYGSWNPVPLFRIYLNGGLNYTDMKTNSSGLMDLENGGLNGRVYAGTQFNLPKDFMLSVNGGYSSPWVTLQGKGSSYYYVGFSANKSFMKKKLTVSLNVNNPFWKTIEHKNTTSDPTFSMQSGNKWSARDFRIGISYRFGTLKDSIKKVRRGISNDDQKGGGNNQGGGEQSM